MSRPLIIAHRGFSSRFPENTLVSFRAAMKLPVDFIEVDVQETADGKLAVFHDLQLRRLCGIRGSVIRTTLARMRQCKPDIPTLAEALRAVRGRCRLLIEMKTVNGVKVAHAIERAGMVDQVIVFSFSTRQLQQVAMTNPEIVLFGLVADDLDASVRQICNAVEIQGIGVGNRLLKTAASMRRLHERVGQVFVWTVNQATRMRELASWGADGIITNRPDVARKLWTVEDVRS